MLLEGAMAQNWPLSGFHPFRLPIYLSHGHLNTQIGDKLQNDEFWWKFQGRSVGQFYPTCRPVIDRSQGRGQRSLCVGNQSIPAFAFPPHQVSAWPIPHGPRPEPNNFTPIIAEWLKWHGPCERGSRRTQNVVFAVKPVRRRTGIRIVSPSHLSLPTSIAWWTKFENA